MGDQNQDPRIARDYAQFPKIERLKDISNQINVLQEEFDAIVSGPELELELTAKAKAFINAPSMETWKDWDSTADMIVILVMKNEATSDEGLFERCQEAANDLIDYALVDEVQATFDRMNKADEPEPFAGVV